MSVLPSTSASREVLRLASVGATLQKKFSAKPLAESIPTSKPVPQGRPMLSLADLAAASSGGDAEGVLEDYESGRMVLANRTPPQSRTCAAPTQVSAPRAAHQARVEESQPLPVSKPRSLLGKAVQAMQRRA